MGFSLVVSGREAGHDAAWRSAKIRSNNAPATPPTSCARMNPGASAGRMPAKVSDKERPTLIAGFAKDVDAVNQYAPAIQAGTRHAASLMDGEVKAISTRPAVATNSASHCAPPVRTCVDACISGSSNIAFASTAPAQQPAICANTYAAACDAPIWRLNSATRVMTGLKCAPLMGPNIAISAASTVTVAAVLASSAIARFPLASLS